MQITKHLENFEEYLNLNTSNSFSTKKKYVTIVRFFLLDHPLGFTMDSINSFLYEKNKGKKNAFNYKYALKHFLVSIGKKSWVENLVKVKTKPRIKQFPYIKRDDVIKIINFLPVKYRKLAFLQYMTGGRFRELITLRIENIDYHIHPKLVYIQVGEFSKGKKQRSLRLNKIHEDKLVAWCEDKTWGFMMLPKEYDRENETELNKVLVNERNYFNKALQKAAYAVKNIPNFSSHYLRHLFADRFLLNGGEMFQLQKILGHSKPETTIRYVSLADKQADEVVSGMS